MNQNNILLKVLLSLFVCLTVMVSQANNENTLYFEPLTVEAGETNVELAVYMQNDVPICNLQTDIYLPVGISISYDEEEEEYAVVKGGRSKTNHNLDCIKQPDGSYRVLISSTSNITFYESESRKGLPIFIMYLNVDTDIKAGNHTLSLKKIVLNNYDFDTKITTKFTPEDVTGTISVHSDFVSLVGDANGDSRVSISDVTTLVDYLTTGNMTDIDMNGADADGNGSVESEDVDALVDILLER